MLIYALKYSGFHATNRLLQPISAELVLEDRSLLKLHYQQVKSDKSHRRQFRSAGRPSESDVIELADNWINNCWFNSQSRALLCTCRLTLPEIRN